VLLYLHKWGEQAHPALRDPQIRPANGLILFTSRAGAAGNMEKRKKAERLCGSSTAPQSKHRQRRISLREIDGYFVSIKRRCAAVDRQKYARMQRAFYTLITPEKFQNKQENYIAGIMSRSGVSSFCKLNKLKSNGYHTQTGKTSRL
jgi:hypothetical protein